MVATMALDAPRREQLLNDLTRRIEKMGMTAPAILFLETYKPLAFLGAQLLWFAQPFLSSVSRKPICATSLCSSKTALVWKN